MEQFEKWNKIHRINDVRLLTEPDINIKEKQRQKGWEAALKWALKSGYIDDYGDDIINSWDIEEELGNE